MNSRKINTLKKMKANIIRRHTTTTNLKNAVPDVTSKRYARDYSRVVEIDRQLKELQK